MSYPRVLRVADLIRVAEHVAGTAVQPLPRRVTLATAALPSGTLLTLEARRPWWDRRRRSSVLAQLQQVMDRARSLERTVVVAAAIVDGDRVLLAQRAHPPELAGRWEFPGGKVEAGESLTDALMRECREELGVALTVGVELARHDLDDRAELVLFAASLEASSPRPRALEHRELRWVSAGELAQFPADEVVASNREFVAVVTLFL